MPNFEVEFEVYCECGEDLCNNSTGYDAGNRNRRSLGVTVGPCPKCLSKEYDKGYDKGYDDGFSEGEAKGDEE